MSDIPTVPVAAPSDGAPPTDGASNSSAPASATWIGLTVAASGGSLMLPFVWVDAPADSADVASALDAFAASTPEFAVTVDVADQVTVTSADESLASTRDALVAALSDLGMAAGYDGDAGTVKAKVAGVDASVAGDGVADGLVDAATNVHDFPGSADAASDQPDAADAPAPDVAPMGLEVNGHWEGVLIVEGTLSGDNRMIQENALTFRDFPLPLMAMFRNPDGGDGHDGAELVGSIDGAERRGNEIWGWGQLDLGGNAGREAFRLLGGPVNEMGMPDASGKPGPVLMRGVSADLDRVEVTWENQMGDDVGLEDVLGFDPGTMYVTAGRIMGATLCQFPSFMEAHIALSDETGLDEGALAAVAGYATLARTYLPWATDALVAAADRPVDGIPLLPPASWFERPTDGELAELRASGRAWRITDDGRIYGFAAVFGELHIGLRKPTHVPKSKSNYAYFRTGEVVCDDGTRVSTGPVVMDCVHPDLTWVASDAATFYHHTGAGVGDLAVWDDERAGGIVVAGALRPGVTQFQLRTLRASDGVSPDWRHIGGMREVVAMLVVNNSGFKTPALAASAGLEEAGDYVVPGTFACHFRVGEDEPMAMVAAGTFAARRPETNAGVIALAAQLASLRREVRSLQAEGRSARAAKALARLSD